MAAAADDDFFCKASPSTECGSCAIVPFGDTIIIIGDTRDPRIKSLNHRLAKFRQKKREKTSSANMEGKTRFLKCQRSWNIASGKILGGLVYNFKG